MEPMLNMIANTSTTHAAIGDTITYKIILKNEDENIFEDIIIKSTLSPELKFISNSVKIQN